MRRSGPDDKKGGQLKKGAVLSEQIFRRDPNIEKGISQTESRGTLPAKKEAIKRGQWGEPHLMDGKGCETAGPVANFIRA